MKPVRASHRRGRALTVPPANKAPCPPAEKTLSVRHQLATFPSLPTDSETGGLECPDSPESPESPLESVKGFSLVSEHGENDKKAAFIDGIASTKGAASTNVAASTHRTASTVGSAPTNEAASSAERARPTESLGLTEFLKG
ncbi:hypothetical protein IAT40_007551 [Kwoniella sp. CBS 6097]